MKHRAHHPPLPLMAAEIAFSSWEVIARRSLLMAQGRCSPAEYQRMVTEKLLAAQRSGAALLASADWSAALAPWHRAATINARRLRRK